MKKTMKNTLFMSLVLSSASLIAVDSDDYMTPAQHAMKKPTAGEHQDSPAKDAMSDSRQKPARYDDDDDYYDDDMYDDGTSSMTPAQKAAKRNTKSSQAKEKELMGREQR